MIKKARTPKPAVKSSELAPAVGVSEELAELIGKHRVASAAYSRATEEMATVHDAYIKQYGAFEVPNFVGKGLSSDDGIETCKHWIKADYVRKRQTLRSLAQSNPDIAEQACSALDRIEFENMALVDRLFAEERARQLAYGLSELMERYDIALALEEAAATALCAFRCSTLKEAQAKAEAIAESSIMDDLDSALAQSFLRSLVPPPPQA